MDQRLRDNAAPRHIMLSVACSVIYGHVNESSTATADTRHMLQILNDVAHAISNIIPIHAHDARSRLPVAIPTLDLIQGKFARGAQVFVRRDGSELTLLTILRGDMETAITILKSAKISFRTPKNG